MASVKETILLGPPLETVECSLVQEMARQRIWRLTRGAASRHTTPAGS